METVLFYIDGDIFRFTFDRQTYAGLFRQYGTIRKAVNESLQCDAFKGVAFLCSAALGHDVYRVKLDIRG